MKIWQKHIFLKLLKTFAFFLFCLFFIYVVIDLSAHGVRFFSKASFPEVALYYLNSFSTLLDLFLALTFLLGTLKVLFDLTTHREIVALQMAGLSKKTLLTPFFLFASLIAMIGYVNLEWIAPFAGEYSSGFKTAYKSKKKSEKEKIYTICFEDESELVYHHFDRTKKELVDVFWIRFPDDIWHMKTLQIDSRRAHFVDHLTRNSLKQFERRENFTSRYFYELPLSSETVLSRFIPYEKRSLSTLLLQAIGRGADARIVFSHLYYKLMSPLIPLIILIALSPIIIQYHRSRPTFLITAVSIFCLLGLKSILDGMLILGENQVLPSYIAIFAPIVLIYAITLPKFVRMQ